MKKHGKNLSLEFTQEWGEKKRLKFEGFSMSDGTLRAIGLLAAVFQRPVPSLIAVEEPEATIHPGALESVLDLLRHASKHMQVVITTHSPELLDAKWITDQHLRIVEWTEGATRVAPVSDVTRKALHDHLMGAGELLRSNALEPAPLFDDQTSPSKAICSRTSSDDPAHRRGTRRRGSRAGAPAPTANEAQAWGSRSAGRTAGGGRNW